MHVATRIFLRRVIDIVMHVALQRPIAAGRIRVQPTPRLDGEVGSLLHGLHGAIAGRLDDDRPVATAPRNHGRPVFVLMAPAWLAFLAATARAASQRLLPPVLGLSRLTSGVIEVIRFNRAVHLAWHFIGQCGIPQPPAPPIAGPDRDAHLAGDAARRAGETEQKGRQYPMRARSLARVKQGLGDVSEGTLAAVAPVALAPRSVVVMTP